MILKDLGHRLELRSVSTLVGVNRLEAVAYARSREGDWMVATRHQRTPRSVATKEAAVAELEAMTKAEPQT